MYFKSFVWGTKAKASLILSKRGPPNNQQNLLKWKYFPVQFPPSDNKQTNKTFFSLYRSRNFPFFSHKVSPGKSSGTSPELGDPRHLWEARLPSFFVHCLPLFNLSPLTPNSGLKVLSRFLILVLWDPIFSTWVPRVVHPGPCFPASKSH